MLWFAARLRELPVGTAPAWSYVDMPDEDHSSTPQRTLYQALESRYAEWRFPFFEDQEELDRAGGLRGLEAHYRRFSTRFGYTAPPPEARLQQVGRIYLSGARHDDVLALAKTYAKAYPVMAEGLVNQVGYELLKTGQVDRAIRTFRQNADEHPQSPNVHDSLGDGYCRAGDAASAMRSYAAAARVAEARSPDHPRLASYRAKAAKGCS